MFRIPWLDPRVSDALLLTGLGALGTGLGGLLVVIQPHFNFKQLGYLQVRRMDLVLLSASLALA